MGSSVGFWLDEQFKITERGSTIATELRAGLTTFMTMAYILVVNPTVLSSCGLPFQAVAFATAATAVVGTAFVGVFGNLPFGLAPGMGLNAYFAFGVCIAKGLPYQAALAVVFLMGIAFALLSLMGACSYLQRVMPSNLKHATTVAIGILQAFIGFRYQTWALTQGPAVLSSPPAFSLVAHRSSSARPPRWKGMINLVVADPHTLVALGDISARPLLLSLATTFLISVLVVHRVQGAMLIGIGISSVISWSCGMHPVPERLVQLPTAVWFWGELDWLEVVARWQECALVLLALLFVCIFDTAGVQFGAGMQAGLLDPKTETLPGTKAAFLGASVATVLGGLLGSSPTIIHNETCAGIAEGGRTGLTALVVASLFALSIFFVPILAAVPQTATAPALIIVGAFMMGPAGAMDWDNFRESLPAFLTIAVMPLTYSIANGVVAGLVSYAILALCSGTLAGALTASTEGDAGGATSASSSAHAVVRDPAMRANGSFGGLSSLGGTASPNRSYQASPLPVTIGSGGSYRPPAI